MMNMRGTKSKQEEERRQRGERKRGRNKMAVLVQDPGRFDSPVLVVVGSSRTPALIHWIMMTGKEWGTISHDSGSGMGQGDEEVLRKV